METASIAEIREEFGSYFEAVQQHPRSLVGREVPSITNPGEMETLRDSSDAKDWQEAVKQSLAQEVRDRSDRKADDLRGTMSTLTASIGVFENNPDLIPNTRQFNKALADKVATTLAPYAVKANDKTIGWSIDVQPLIASLRDTMKPAPAPAGTAATPTPAQQRAAAQARDTVGRFDAPQAGIPSRSGSSSSEGEDFSTLFGTIGLSGLRI